MKYIQTDNAKEFPSLNIYLNTNDTHHHFTCTRTHEQNGFLAQKHRLVSLLDGHFLPL